MKRLYLLLSQVAVSLLVASSWAMTAGCNHNKKEDETAIIVYKALKKFDQNNPLKIIIYNKTKPIILASDEAIAMAIKLQMQLKNPNVFTDEALEKITFDDTHFQENALVSVPVTYNNDNKKIPIYVKENTQGVSDALKRFDQAHPIKIPYHQANPQIRVKDPAILPKIKSQMQSRDPIFKDKLLSNITFSDTLLKPNTAIAVQATYGADSVTIYVKEHDSSKVQKVINALKTFNSPATAVKIDPRYAGKYADEYGGITKRVVPLDSRFKCVLKLYYHSWWLALRQ